MQVGARAPAGKSRPADNTPALGGRSPASTMCGSSPNRDEAIYSSLKRATTRHPRGGFVFGLRADVPDVEAPVNEIIEHVARTGGMVEFVPAEALRESEHIGLVLR